MMDAQCREIGEKSREKSALPKFTAKYFGKWDAVKRKEMSRDVSSEDPIRLVGPESPTPYEVTLMLHHEQSHRQIKLTLNLALKVCIYVKIFAASACVTYYSHCNFLPVRVKSDKTHETLNLQFLNNLLAAIL